MPPDERKGSTPAARGRVSSTPDAVEGWMSSCLALPASERDGAIERLAQEHPGEAEEIRGRWRALRGFLEAPEMPSTGEFAFPERLGDFRLLRRIGGGGMGVVFLARQESLGREVALKLVRPEQLVFSPSARERFRREVEAVARLHHEGIVPVFSVGEEQGIPFYAMELVDGVTLADVLDRLSGRAAESLTGRDLAAAIGAGDGGIELAGSWSMVALSIVSRVAHALHHAHERGVIHRDVKPSNVMITRRGRVMVLDFGLARAEGSARLTASQCALGSLAYMPPEQIRGGGGEPAPSADVYSLGATLYELLTLRPPFPGEGQEQTRRRILEGRPRPLRAWNPAVPRDAETVCLAAMDPDPARRYASAALFARDLENVMELRSIEARRPGAWTRTMRFAQRSPWLALALALLFVLVIVVPTGFALYERQRSAASNRSEYASSVLAASASLQAHEVRETRRLLAACKPELRGWEWRHLSARSDSSLAVFRVHPDIVQSLGMLPDGTGILSGGRSGAVVLTDVRTGNVIRRFPVSPDASSAEAHCVVAGERVAFAGLPDGRVLSWDLATGELLQAWQAHEGNSIRPTPAVMGLVLSPDARLLVSASWNGEVCAWQLGSAGWNAARRVSVGTPLSCLALDSLRGRLAVGSSPGVVHVLDAGSLETLATWSAHETAIATIDFSPDGGRVLTASHDTSLRVWEVESGENLLTLRGHDHFATCAAFHPDGRRIHSGSTDKTLRTWDAESGELIAVHHGHEDGVSTLVVSPLGERVFTGSLDHTLRAWDPSARDVLLPQSTHRTWIRAMSVLPDGSVLATASWDYRLRIWDAATGAPRLEIPFALRDVVALALSADGERIAAGGYGGGSVGVWDARSGAPLEGFAPPVANVACLAFDPEGELLAGACEDGSIRLWDASTGALLGVLEGHAGPARTVVFEPSGERIVSGSADGTLKIWDVPTARCLATLGAAGPAVLALALAPGGERLAAAGEDRVVRLWELRSSRLLAALEAHERPVSALAFSPDGLRLASGSSDGTIRVWEARHFMPLCVLRGHGDEVTGLFFTPDGGRLLSSSNDRTVREWASSPVARR